MSSKETTCAIVRVLSPKVSYPLALPKGTFVLPREVSYEMEWNDEIGKILRLIKT